MPRTVEIKPSPTPSQLRRLAASTKDANQSRRLLSIAAVLDGMSRAEAAKIGGMDRQTLRDWVHRFNAWPGRVEGQPTRGYAHHSAPRYRCPTVQPDSASRHHGVCDHCKRRDVDVGSSLFDQCRNVCVKLSIFVPHGRAMAELSIDSSGSPFSIWQRWRSDRNSTCEPNSAFFFRELANHEQSGNCPTMFGINQAEASPAFVNGSLGNLIELDDTDRRDRSIPRMWLSRQFLLLLRLARAVGPGPASHRSSPPQSVPNLASCPPFTLDSAKNLTIV
jgi:hypothetical protein